MIWPHELKSVIEKLDEILERLERIERTQEKIKELQIMAAATLASLQADVTDETTVVGGVVTLLTNLSTQLKAAIASGNMAQVQAIQDLVDKNKTALAAAVAANTPGNPPPPGP